MFIAYTPSGRIDLIEIIGEIGINHNGDLEIAKKLITIAAAAGMDYVKLQKRTIDAVYSKEELDKPRDSPWGTTTREQKEGLEFNFSDYTEINTHCNALSIPWFASPWDIESIHFLNYFKMPFLKIPSALITDVKFLEVCKATPFPFILSTGMSTEDMIAGAVDVLGIDRIYCIMHCTSTYPSKEKEQNIEYINVLKDRYPKVKIGFSNHSPGLLSMIAAMANGAEMIEMHITLDRSMYGSDQPASIEPSGIFKFCKYARDIENIMGDGVKQIYPSEVPIIKKLRANVGNR